MRLFFFGTLLDRELREAVLGRAPPAGAVEPAVACGFRRVAVAGRPYPMLVAAAAGRVDEATIARLLAHPFFALPPPKSLDRNDFSAGPVAGLSLEDGAATLTAFTAASIAKAREHMPIEPRVWVICGGGRKNRTLMSMLAAHVANAVVPAEALGLNGDFIEAEAWAYLAVRSLLGLPITYPDTTGVAQPLTGGVLAKAPR